MDCDHHLNVEITVKISKPNLYLWLHNAWSFCFLIVVPSMQDSFCQSAMQMRKAKDLSSSATDLTFNTSFVKNRHHPSPVGHRLRNGSLLTTLSMVHCLRRSRPLPSATLTSQTTTKLHARRYETNGPIRNTTPPIHLQFPIHFGRIAAAAQFTKTELACLATQRLGPRVALWDIYLLMS